MRIETREKIENLLRHTTLLCVSFIDHHKLTINVYIHEYIYTERATRCDYDDVQKG